MRRYKTIRQLKKDERNLQDGERIVLSGLELTYHKNPLTSVTMGEERKEELGLGAMVEDDMTQLGIRHGSEEIAKLREKYGNQEGP